MLARRIAAGLVAFVVLLGVLRGGSRYVYCPMMAAVMTAPCCASETPDEHDDGHEDPAPVALREGGCCEGRTLARLPSAATSGAPAMLEPPVFVALLPAAALRVEPAPLAWPQPRLHEDRAGPMRAARHRAELMVFLS